MPLESGTVVTVEPGVYFIPMLLEDAERRREDRSEVDWNRVDALLGFGGIPIEDNVLIADKGHGVITSDVPLPD
jgi:Xaa-Pro aminopeptidase